jgi:preprotein translocase subunit Sec63
MRKDEIGKKVAKKSLHVFKYVDKIYWLVISMLYFQIKTLLTVFMKSFLPN